MSETAKNPSFHAYLRTEDESKAYGMFTPNLILKADRIFSTVCKPCRKRNCRRRVFVKQQCNKSISFVIEYRSLGKLT